MIYSEYRESLRGIYCSRVRKRYFTIKGRWEERTIKRYKGIILTTYGAVAVVMFFIILLNLFWTERGTGDFGLGTYRKVSDDWQDVNGEPMDFKKIDDYAGAGAEDIRVFYPIPEDMHGTQGLVFRTKNVYVNAYIGGRMVYGSDVTEAPFDMNSPGTKWNVLRIDEEYAGEQVELRIVQAYQDGRSKVDNFYLGDWAAVLLFVIESKGFGLLISILIMVVGFFLVVADFLLNGRNKGGDRSLFYLGLFAVLAAGWCLIETNIFQLFVKNIRPLQLVDNILLVMGVLPLFFYMEETYHVFGNRLIRVLCGIDAAYLVVITVLHMTGFQDLHQTQNGTVLNYGLVSLLLGGYIIRDILQRAKEKTGRFYLRMQTVGIICLCVGIFVDFLRYVLTDVLDRALTIRVGLLLFIISFGSGNLYRLYELIKQGYQTEIISRLAYVDGLTEVGNRTAYIEKKEELLAMENRAGLAVAMFDVNNLKKVNDSLGHSAGDELIRESARIIQRSFGSLGMVYRIGGDEFVVLFQSEHPENSYEKAKQVFEEELARCNEEDSHPFTISIAHGYAYCEKSEQGDIEGLEKQADQMMYKNKREMKLAYAQ